MGWIIAMGIVGPVAGALVPTLVVPTLVARFTKRPLRSSGIAVSGQFAALEMT